MFGRIGLKRASNPVENTKRLNPTSGDGVTTPSNCISTTNGIWGVGVKVGVSEMAGVSEIVGVSEVVGERVIVGESVIVGSMVGVGEISK